MPRKSKIRTLDPKARSFIEKLLREDRLTLREMIAQIAAKFPPDQVPSTSGLHRYQQSMNEIAGRMRDIEAVSQALVGELGDSIGEKSGALLAQAVTTAVTHAALRINESEDASIEEVRKLARASKDALDVRRLSLNERQAIEKAARDKLLAEQSAALDAMPKSAGASAETIDFFRREILGLR